MFFQKARQLRDWWEAATTDILGADLPPAEPEGGSVIYFQNHPHRHQLSTGRERRSGAVPARPAHCLSPVRAGARRDLGVRS